MDGTIRLSVPYQVVWCPVPSLSPFSCFPPRSLKTNIPRAGDKKQQQHSCMQNKKSMEIRFTRPKTDEFVSNRCLFQQRPFFCFLVFFFFSVKRLFTFSFSQVSTPFFAVLPSLAYYITIYLSLSLLPPK